MNNAVGIDIGGTKIAIAMVDTSGGILAVDSFPTDAPSGCQIAIDRIIHGVEKVIAKAGLQPQELIGIGIGCTGPVDPKRGTVHNPYTLPTWDNCDLVTPIATHFSVPVRLENDADVAAIGELVLGAGREATSMVMLTFGTGIGFSAVVEGKIYRGVDGSHPEFGHIPTPVAGPRCYCGIDGCLESLASGTAIEARGRLQGFKSGRSVFLAAAAGDSRATAIVDDAVRAAAFAIWTVAHSFLPQRIVLGGGMMDDQFEPFARAMKQMLGQSTLAPKEEISIVKAELGSDAGAIGAACLALPHCT